MSEWCQIALSVLVVLVILALMAPAIINEWIQEHDGKIHSNCHR